MRIFADTLATLKVVGGMLGLALRRQSICTTLILAAFLAAAGSAAAAPPSALSIGVEEQGGSHTETTDCAAFKGLDVSAATVNCGYLVAPENRQNPQSRTIKIAYAVVKARGADPRADPVVFLAGGPGDSAIDGIVWWAALPMSKDRDLILVDPRGAGYSQPAMRCPDRTPTGVSVHDGTPAAGDALAQHRQWAQQCHDLLISQGFDLTAYNSTANAADLNDLRLALGYPQWNLYGLSYGTRVALVAMRAFPDGIRSVVLDSVILPQADQIGRADLAATTGSLSALFASCEADPACAHDYPDLETQFDETIQRLDQNPVQVSVPDGETGKKQPVWITGAAVVAGLRTALKTPIFAQIMPITIARLHSGDSAILGKLYGILVSDANLALQNTVLCHDAAALFDPGQLHADLEKYPALQSFYAGDEQAAICQIWEAGQAAQTESQPVQSDIPTLLLAGGDYDFASPANSKLAATGLSHHFSVDFPAYGHFVTTNECPQAVMAGFLSDPTRAPDADCAAKIKGLGFVTDVYQNRAAGPLFLAAQFVLPAWLMATLGVIGLIFLCAVVYLPVAYLRSRPQGARISPSHAAGLTLWLVAFLTLGFGIGAWLLSKKALADNYGWVTLFGFSPASSEILFIIPWLTAILTLGLLVFAFAAWKKRWWKLPARAGFAVVTAAAISFNCLMIYWQLFAS